MPFPQPTFKGINITGDLIRFFVYAIVVTVGLFLLDSWLTDTMRTVRTTVRPRIDKFADDFNSSLRLQTAQDAVLDSIRQYSGLHRPEFSYKWEVVPLTKDRYRMTSMECSLDKGERICRSFTATVDTGEKKKIEEIRFH